MEINERVVISKPPSLMPRSKRAHNAWTKQRVLNEIWEIRKKYLREKGCDIFQLFTMTDCVEFTLKGDIEALEVPKKKKTAPYLTT